MAIFARQLGILETTTPIINNSCWQLLSIGVVIWVSGFDIEIAASCLTRRADVLHNAESQNFLAQSPRVMSSFSLSLSLFGAKVDLHLAPLSTMNRHTSVLRINANENDVIYKYCRGNLHLKISRAKIGFRLARGGEEDALKTGWCTHSRLCGPGVELLSCCRRAGEFCPDRRH